MEWDEASRTRLETALNESDVVGVRLAPSGDHADVLLHVVSLPPTGPLARDGRRVLRLTGPTRLRFLLRRDRRGEQLSSQPPEPLADMAAVEDFFESLTWGGSIYGWRFFDEPSLTSDWPSRSSLDVTVSTKPAPHSFYWFNECARADASYTIEGTIGFTDLAVLDAREHDIPMQTFIADGVRQWEALFGHDERMSSEAQRLAQDGAPTWRRWAQRT